MKESMWTAPHPDCPHPELWNAVDSMSCELEVSRFLGQLCTLLRPERVLETGTYYGQTTRAMGRALIGVGYVDSVEKDQDRCAAARAATEGLPVSVHLTDSLSFEPETPFDLMFFDARLEHRRAEILRYRIFASQRCVWVLHDAYHPVLVAAVRELEAAGVVRAATMLPTPRGLMIGRYC